MLNQTFAQAKFWLILGMLVCALSVAKAWANPIYVYTDKSGAIRFTNKAPPAGVSAKVFTAQKAGYSVIVGSRSSGRLGTGRVFSNHYIDLIDRAALRHRVDRNLIRAVIHAESAFNPQAISPKGARGLMQLMPEVAKQWRVYDVHSPAQNIEGGTAHLALLLRRYDGNLSNTLAAYNAGEGAVEKYGGIPPYPETRGYVKKVLALFKRYSGATRSVAAAGSRISRR